MVRKSAVLSILFIRFLRGLPYCALVLLAACGTPTKIERGESPPMATPTTLVPPQAVTEDSLGNALLVSEQAGNYTDAALEYQRLAMEQQGEQRANFQLQEIAALLRAYRLEAANEKLQKIDRGLLTLEQEAYWRFMLAQVSASLQRPAQALRELESINIDNLAEPLRSKALLLRAQLLFALGRAAEMLNERWLLEPLLEGEDIAKNRQQLWGSLMAMPKASLQALTQVFMTVPVIESAKPVEPAQPTASSKPAEFIERAKPIEPFAAIQPIDANVINQGWVTLALLARQYSLGSSLASQQLLQGLYDWQLRYRVHPALETIVPKLIAREQLSQRPNRVAVFLPESGPLLAMAKVIRQGLLEAYYQDMDARPALRFYDTASGIDIVTLYWTAVEEGADIVLGPLNKSQVGTLHNMTEWPVPLLALNSVDALTAWPDTLYRYGLFPEDEVRGMLNEAAQDGYQQTLLMYPQSHWGERMAKYVRSMQSEDGVQRVGEVAYDENKSDFSVAIKRLIGIDKSNARKKKLAQLLRQRLTFTPRKRQDADAIFLIARAEKARQIRPQLLFHYAADLPVYTTSHPYKISANRVALRDLDNTVFVDLPWNRHGSKDVWTRIKDLPLAAQPYARFYVFGMDAYALLPYLHYLKRHSGEFYAGYSGRLHMDGSGKVHRDLMAWEVHRGKVRPKTRINLSR